MIQPNGERVEKGGSRIPEFENSPKSPKRFRYQKIDVTEPLYGCFLGGGVSLT